MRRLCLLCLWAAAAACGPSVAAPSPRRADKSALFGDPTLVPTRQGEAARREIALAAEMGAALRATGWIEEARVDVEDRAPARVLVAGRRAPSAPADLEARIRAVALTVVADDAIVTIVLADPASPPPPRAIDLPLGVALFGLGASLALTADRAWRRRRRATTRLPGHRAPR